MVSSTSISATRRSNSAILIPPDRAMLTGGLRQYENGHVSICASAAAGSNEGFLKRRKCESYRYKPFELPYCGPNNRLGSIKLVQYLDYSKMMDPVTARAWIMQESLLAPRILSYSYQGVEWSCRKANNSDGGPSREWYDFEDRVMWAKLQDKSSVQLCIRNWNRLVESYTSRSLSDPKDRLPAISGIAQKYVRLLQRHLSADWDPRSSELDRVNGKAVECADYVAGLWYCKLSPQSAPIMFSHQLLWSTWCYKAHHQSTDDEALRASTLVVSRNSPVWRPTPRNSRFQCSSTNHNSSAPSWSWASVGGPIAYEDVESVLALAAVLSCDTKLELSEAPYGNVSLGKLTIRGSLIPVLEYTLSNRFRFRWKLVFRPDTNERAALLPDIIEGKVEGWVLPITTLGISTTTKPKDPDWTDNTPKGLLIVAEGEYYRRIGLCSIKPTAIEPTVGNVSIRFSEVEARLRSYDAITITIIWGRKVKGMQKAWIRDQGWLNLNGL